MTAILSLDRARARLTPDNALLLVIDAQVGPLWELEFARLRTSLGALTRAAAARRIPTIVTTIATDRWGPTISEISTNADGAIERSVVCAWDEPRIREAVSAAGRAKLIIAGGAPEYSLAPSASAAADAGYDVYAAVDLSSSSANRRHAVRMFRAGVIVIDPALLVAELAGGRGDSDATFRGRHDGRCVARA